MVTRRNFFGTVAALAMSPLAAKAAPVAAETVVPVVGAIDTATFPFWRSQASSNAAFDQLRPAMWDIYNRCRRDDGDTILELR